MLTVRIVVALALGFLMGEPVQAQETLPNDVTVTFSVCLEGSGVSGPVCITGNNDVLSNWQNGVEMTSSTGDLFTVDIVFPTGTEAALGYKYRANGCVDWEFDPNRSMTLPTDGTTSLVVETESFNRVTPIGCGLSTPLEADVTVCFQNCLQGVEYTGAVCIIGDHPELGEWNTSIPAEEVGPDLFQHCLTISQGTMVPMDIQWKFQKDDCATWENVDPNPLVNRRFTVTAEDSGSSITVTNSWNNGDGVCDSVPALPSSWGLLKTRFEN